VVPAPLLAGEPDRRVLPVQRARHAARHPRLQAAPRRLPPHESCPAHGGLVFLAGYRGRSARADPPAPSPARPRAAWTDYVPAKIPVWGNVRTLSFEPYCERVLNAGRETRWSITYAV
jgi:hypothetical protein